MMRVPSKEIINAALKEYCEEEISSLRGSIGSDNIRIRIMEITDSVEKTLGFISRFRVVSATLSLIGGDIPMVRVKIRDTKNGLGTRVVGPTSWAEDVINICKMSPFGMPRGSIQMDRLVKFLKSLIPNDRLTEVESEIKLAVSAALSDETKIEEIKVKLNKRRESEKQRLMKMMSQTFSGIPPDLLTEEDIVRLYRENVIRRILTE